MPGKGFREEIADRLELPAGAAGLVKLTVMGRSRALIEDHRGSRATPVSV